MQETSPFDPERRSVMRRLGTALLGLLGALEIAPALAYLFDPLRRVDRAAAGAGAVPVPVAALSDVPDVDQGGQPLQAVVIARDRRDAWNRLSRVREGSVWLYRRSRDLVCLSTVCPHAGCAIDFDEGHQRFVCPCHGSTFALDGTRRDGPSPRGMDTLEVEVTDGQVMCQYRRFRLAVSRKEPV